MGARIDAMYSHYWLGQVGIEFNLSSTRVPGNRPILVNGETTVNHVDECAREFTFRVLSGSSGFVGYGGMNRLSYG